MKKRTFHLSLILIGIVLFFCGAAVAQQSNVIVPNVEGISQGIAAQILRTAGLQPQVQQSANSGTLVIRQDPRPGSLLPMGSAVLLVTDVRTPVTQVVPESRSLPAVQSTTTGTSPAFSSQRTTGTNVSVVPLTTTQPATQVEQYTVTQDSMNFIIARQPQQAPANQYLLVETTAKRLSGLVSARLSAKSGAGRCVNDFADAHNDLHASGAAACAKFGQPISDPGAVCCPATFS